MEVLCIGSPFIKDKLYPESAILKLGKFYYLDSSTISSSDYGDWFATIFYDECLTKVVGRFPIKYFVSVK